NRGDHRDGFSEMKWESEIEAGETPHGDEEQSPETECDMQIEINPWPTGTPQYGKGAFPLLPTRPPENNSCEAHQKEKSSTYGIDAFASRAAEKLIVQILEEAEDEMPLLPYRIVDKPSG